MEFITNKKNFILPGLVGIAAMLWFHKKRGLAFVLSIAIIIIFNDFLTNAILKPLFARPRPCHVLEGFVNAARCSNSLSFPSAHASNIFTAATLFSLVYRNTLLLAFTLAGLVGYSRVYLGVHYPADVVAGAALGIFMGFLGYKIYNKILSGLGGAPVPASPKRFLIVKLSSLGDIVHTLPVLRTLRENYPKAFIAWVVEEKVKDVLYRNPDLDELIVVRTKYWRRHWSFQTFGEIRQVIRRIRGFSFDTVFDFQGLFKSGVIAFLTGAPNRIGFHRADCRELLNILFINRKAPYVGKKAHVVEKNLALLKTIGVEKFHYQFPIEIPGEADGYIEAFLKNNPELIENPVIAINPGVGFKTKRWKLERFAELADRIAGELGHHIIFTWGPGEKKTIDAITSRMSQRFWVAPPTTVHQSMALYRHLNLFIGCDTGPLHLCAAMGVPTVSIFGPTDPVRNGPYGCGHEVVYKTLPCSFCYKRKCPTKNECMEEVQVEEVFERVKKNIYNLENVPAS